MSLLNDALRQNKSESRPLPTTGKGMHLKSAKELRRNNPYLISALVVGVISVGVLLFSYFHTDSKATTLFSDTPPEISDNDPVNDVSNPIDPISSASAPEADQPLPVDKTIPTAPNQVKVNANKAKHPQIDKAAPKVLSPKVTAAPIKKTIQRPSDIEVPIHLAKKRKKNRGNRKVPLKPVPQQPSVSPLYEKARLYHGQKRFKEAIDIYREVLKMDSQHSDARFNLISAYLQTKEFGKSYAPAADLFHQRPDNPEIMLNLAIASIGIGDAKKGLALLNKAQQRSDAPLYEIYFHQGIANRHLGQIDTAVACYRKAEHINPNDPRLLFNLAVAQDQQQHYEEAIQYYLKYIRTLKNKDSSIQRHVEQRIQALQMDLLNPQAKAEIPQ
jgi:Flp pilus assembly protein TadD